MGAIVTLFYSFIAVGMSAAYPLEPRSAVSYETGGGNSPVGVMFGTFNAITTIIFAFGGHNIALVSLELDYWKANKLLGTDIQRIGWPKTELLHSRRTGDSKYVCKYLITLFMYLCVMFSGDPGVAAGRRLH